MGDHSCSAYDLEYSQADLEFEYIYNTVLDNKKISSKERLYQSKLYTHLIESEYEPCSCIVPSAEWSMSELLARLEDIPAELCSGLSKSAWFLINYQNHLMDELSREYTQCPRREQWTIQSTVNPPPVDNSDLLVETTTTRLFMGRVVHITNNK
jgi:hypothetical protein